MSTIGPVFLFEEPTQEQIDPNLLKKLTGNNTMISRSLYEGGEAFHTYNKDVYGFINKSKL
jgi:hypothetical protein